MHTVNSNTADLTRLMAVERKPKRDLATICCMGMSLQMLAGIPIEPSRGA